MRPAHEYDASDRKHNNKYYKFTSATFIGQLMVISFRAVHFYLYFLVKMVNCSIFQCSNRCSVARQWSKVYVLVTFLHIYTKYGIAIVLYGYTFQCHCRCRIELNLKNCLRGKRITESEK